jgi:hypothetical protein
MDLEFALRLAKHFRMTKASPFRYFYTGPKVMWLAVMMDVRFPLAMRNVEGILP